MQNQEYVVTELRMCALCKEVLTVYA